MSAALFMTPATSHTSAATVAINASSRRNNLNYWRFWLRQAIKAQQDAIDFIERQEELYAAKSAQ